MKITFSSMLSTFVVHAPEGTLVSLSATPTEIGDGVYAVGDSGTVLVDEEYQTDTIYLSTEGEDYTVEAGERICYPAEDIVVWGGNAPDRNPFKSGRKGGGGSGGDNTHYKGTTTTAISNGSTTNPITIDGEEYTAVFGDIVVYNYTEFVFDGTAWSEFGRPFDTTPTSGSANAVTSDGVWARFNSISTSLISQGANPTSVKLGNQGISTASYTLNFGQNSEARIAGAIALGQGTYMNSNGMAVGQYNATKSGAKFLVGNGTSGNARSNILEVTSNVVNVNGDIQQNGVPIRATTMPTITASMLGKVVQYVGTTDANYTQGWFYIASSDGAAEPTYSWVSMVDATPTSGSKNFVTSDGVYKRTPFTRSTSGNSAYLGYGSNVSGNGTENCLVAANASTSSARNCAVIGGVALWANHENMTVIGKANNPKTGDYFEIGNGADYQHRSNIVEVNSTEMNVNGDIKRDGVGIDDYTTTERKIGKWIDGSDLYQRTFEVTGLTESDQWVFNTNILGTSNIDIKDFKGYTEWSDGTNTTRFDLNFYLSNGIHSVCLNSTSDLAISLNHESTSLVKAVITIKYTKPSEQVNALNANIQQTEEVSETPTAVEEDDMR